MSMCVGFSPSPPDGPKPDQTSKKPSISPVPHNMVSELPQLRERTSVREKSSLQMQPIHNDLIPDELLTALTSTACPQDRLGPPKLTKTPKDLKVCLLHRPDALWGHSATRKKYQHFLNQPTSLTGAGRDISFLCDALEPQRGRMALPPMAERSSTQLQEVQKDLSSMKTLIPEEYHIVKNKGVKGLHCYEDKFTVLLEDEKKKLRVFPSMKPSSRFEALQLMKVMDDMLEKAGVNQEIEDLTKLSQMENLLELVRIEQNIYNIVFHELIRQVSVECAERGQVLAKLRQRYVALLDRIPRQLKGLHTDTLAQRALDRRLTEEIVHFKSSVSKLNMELSMMKDHDECVSKEMEETREELAKALEQSQQNANIVAEYHDLYEMQRHRLEGQLSQLSDERDLWRKVAYSLAVKIMRINKLQLVRRLNVSEQTWAKTAQHFTVFLTAKDSEDFSHVMELTDQWKEKLTTTMENLKKTENNQCSIIKSVHANIVRWHKFCEDKIRSSNTKSDESSEEELCLELKQWSTMLTEQCERYGGDDLVSGQETLDMLTHLQEYWIEICLQLFRRHPTRDGGPPKGQEAMRELTKTITELHKQLGIRISGESGIHAKLMSLTEAMEFWGRRLKSLSGLPKGLPAGDWIELEEALRSWATMTDKVLLLVDGTQSERERVKQKPHTKIEIDGVFKTMKEFLFSQENVFDCENMRLSEEAISIHTQLIRWMVDLLLMLVPVNSDNQEALPMLESNIFMDVSVEKLEKDARNLSGKLDYFSKYITSSCQAIVEEVVRKTSTHNDTENELYQLAKLQKECGEWLEVCRILLMDVKGSPVELEVSGKTVPQSVSDVPLEDASMESLLEEHPEVPEDTKEDDEEQLAMKDVGRRHSLQRADDYGEEKVSEASRDDQDGSVIRLIGHDSNITKQTFGEDTVQLTGTDELVLSPHTENARQAFNALETVRALQQELLGVEARAVSAEARALRAEEDLQAALNKIQDLERQLQAQPSVETKVSKRNVKSAPKTPRTEAKAVSRKPEASPKQTKGTKKL